MANFFRFIMVAGLENFEKLVYNHTRFTVSSPKLENESYPQPPSI